MNIEFIKIYDEQFNDKLSNTIISNFLKYGSNGKSINHIIKDNQDKEDIVTIFNDIDHNIFESVKRSFIKYITQFPTATNQYTSTLNDIGYFFTDTEVEERTNVSDIEGLYDCIKVLKFILFLDDDVSINFPYDGLTVKGRVGRVLIFPSQWTTRYSITKDSVGKFIETSMVYSS